VECPFSDPCSGECEYWAAIPFENIWGFLFEPGSSSGLVRFPPDKLIRNICGVVRDAGGLVLVNEVTTGVGRTGRWFGYQHYGISPDIVAMGKGIGNGYPVSVTAISSRAEELMGDTVLKYAQSHQNDPLGAAVALEVIRVIQDDGLIERSRESGVVLVNGLNDIKSRNGRIEEIRSRGLMAAIDLDDDSEMSFTIEVHRELARRGFLVGRRPGVNVLRLDPSLTIRRDDIAAFLETFDNVVAGK
jgi:acetylornithine aminotransferase